MILKAETVSIQNDSLKQKILHLVSSYEGIKHEVLAARMMGDYQALSRDTLHTILADMIENEVITTLNYYVINRPGKTMYFPASTTFIHSGGH